MSIQKYIKEPSNFQRWLQIVLFFILITMVLIWIIHIFIAFPSNALLIFFYPELYFFWGSLFCYIFLYIRAWKFKIFNAESDIYETIVYRSKTSIKNIAKVKKLKEKYVQAIIERLITQEKLFGVIKDGLYISDRTMVPLCSLCNKNIDDKILMVLCPFCKRP
ncbi:MAG: hypothetical protein ACTSQJ_13200, partial [Promethearchaeota archaeon]